MISEDHVCNGLGPTKMIKMQKVQKQKYVLNTKLQSTGKKAK